MSQVGRISGPLLKSNLERNGIDLKISNTSSSSPTLKLDVTNNRIGIGTNSPISELQVPTAFNTQNLIATGTVNVADFTLSNQEINVNSGNIEVDSGSIIEASAVATDAIKIEENNIYGTTSNEPIELKPSDSYWNEQDKIFASSRARLDQFGTSVDISGDYAIIGTPGQDTSPSFQNEGVAYIFKKSGNTWTQQQELEADDPHSDKRFGTCVAIDGDYAIVGNQYNTISGLLQAGSAYIFKRTGSTWTQQQKIISDDSGAYYRFGVSVDISGDTVVIGEARTAGTNIGRAYVWTRSGDTWTQQQKLEHPSPAQYDNFGESVSISGNSVAVGVPGRDEGLPGNSSTGSVVVYTRSGSTWTYQQQLVANDPSLQALLGQGESGLDIDGDNLIVGAKNSDIDGLNSAGSAYIFTRTGSTWTQQQKLVATTPTANDKFGTTVRIDGNYAFVYNQMGSLSGIGNVIVYRKTNNVWTLIQTLTSSDNAVDKSDYNFGYGLGVDNGNIIIGEYGNNDNEGVAYIYTEVFPKTDIQSDLDVGENLHATGNITFGGTITLGSGVEDEITFAADVASNIVPDVDDTYIFGRDTGLDSTTQRLGNTFVDDITADTAIGDAVIIDGVDYALGVGNSFYVSEEGDDTNRGDHPQGAFRTIKHALSAVDGSQGGPTTIHISAGTYTEEFPLTVPESTNIMGAGFREVEIKPTVATQDKDCFLLTGQTTVSNVTLMDYYYNSGNDTGYGFRYANNAITSTRSPYIQNVSVITKGSVTSASDPRGFNQGDAGRGALVDGSVLDSNSVQASMLFHSVTFITPGAVGLRMKDGVRVEWLNSFTYFADIGLQAVNGSTGFVSPHDGSTRNYGAELRSIGSANVYGNKGAVADGDDCLMYLIQHNMAYIGTGGNKENDKTLRVEANEISELNNGNIYFQTTDALGKFKVGNSFFADFETGTTSIDADTVAFDNLSEIRITTGMDTTFIDGTRIDTGNLLLSGNKISSTTGNLTIDPITKIEMRSNVTMQGKLDLTGDISIGQTLTKIGDEASDTVKFNMDFTQNIEPDIGGRFNLGSTSKRWRDIFVSEANISDIKIFDNQITTTVSNSDLEFAANGTGRIYIENNNVQIDNDLEVLGTTTVPELAPTGDITQTGNSNLSRIYAITGSLTATNITVPRDVALKQFDIRGNQIYSTVTNGNIFLRADGSGEIKVPYNRVKIDNDLTVGKTLTVNVPSGNIEVFGNISDPNYTYPKAYTFTANGITYTYNAVGEDDRNYFVGIGNLNIPGFSIGWYSTDVYTNAIKITYTPQSATDTLKLHDTNGIAHLGLRPNTYQAPSTTGLNFTSIIDSGEYDTGKILINDNYITTTESNDDLALSAAGSGNVLIENLRFGDGDSTANEIYTLSGDLEFTPADNVTISGTSALLLPIGNEAARRNTLGDIRFNNSKNLFEGYSTGVLTLGGVYSDDQLTFVNVNPIGNYIDFEVAGSNVATINSTQFEMPGLQAGDVLIDGNTITTVTSNADLEPRANGTGNVVITGFTDTTFTNNIIDNTFDGALTINATDKGYAKIGDTYGVRIPTGDNSNRDAGDSTGNQIGDTRYNTQGEYLETWDGNLWQVSAGGGGETVSQDEMEQLILEYSLALG